MIKKPGIELARSAKKGKKELNKMVDILYPKGGYQAKYFWNNPGESCDEYGWFIVNKEGKKKAFIGVNWLTSEKYLIGAIRRKNEGAI